MKNYKKIRQEPYIYGFTILGFISFTIMTVLCLLILLIGFSFLNMIICFILIGISYLICRHVLSNDKVNSYLFDNKLPKKYSKYE